MKNRIIRIMSLVITLLTVFLPSCGVDRGKAVMTLGKSAVTDKMYQYWVCTYKANLLRRYSDAKDAPEFWDKKLDGKTTAEEYFNGLISDKIKANLVSMYLFDEYGLELDEDDVATADEIIAEYLESYANGDEKRFDKLLSIYGVDRELLREIFIEELKSTYVYNRIFEKGTVAVGPMMKEQYLADNYAHIKHIYINNKYDPSKSYYDESGNFVLMPWGDDEKAGQDAKVEAAKAALDTEDFDKVYKEYSDETSYPNGYYVCATTAGLPTELIERALSMEIGETAIFESDYGTHIVLRLDVEKGAYASEEYSDFFDGFTDAVYEKAFDDFIASYYERIEIDETAVKEFTVRWAEPNYSYRY